jgi:hypothetical protein
MGMYVDIEEKSNQKTWMGPGRIFLAEKVACYGGLYTIY